MHLQVLKMAVAKAARSGVHLDENLSLYSLRTSAGDVVTSMRNFESLSDELLALTIFSKREAGRTERLAAERVGAIFCSGGRSCNTFVESLSMALKITKVRVIWPSKGWVFL